MDTVRPLKSSLIVLAVFLAGLFLAARTASGEDIWAEVTRISWLQLLILLALSGVNYLFRAMRWFLYSSALGIALSPTQVIRHFIGGFALTMTPARLGELVRIRWINKEAGTPYETATPLVVVDRAADLAAMGLLLAASVALMTGGIRGAVPVAGLAILTAVLVTRPALFRRGIRSVWRMVGKKPRLFVRLRRGAEALMPFSDARLALPAMALGFFGWFAEGFAFYLLMSWMGSPLALWTCIGIFVFSMISGGLTGMPGGLGGAEAAMVALLSLQGVPLETAIPATAIIRVTTLWFAVALGLLVFPIAEAKAAKAGYALERN
jgi:uncharacterized protein (TIRG00374 family)